MKSSSGENVLQKKIMPHKITKKIKPVMLPILNELQYLYKYVKQARSFNLNLK